MSALSRYAQYLDRGKKQKQNMQETQAKAAARVSETCIWVRVSPTCFLLNITLLSSDELWQILDNINILKRSKGKKNPKRSRKLQSRLYCHLFMNLLTSCVCVCLKYPSVIKDFR